MQLLTEKATKQPGNGSGSCAGAVSLLLSYHNGKKLSIDIYKEKNAEKPNLQAK
ncbi:MAG: hypothetical protein IJW62_08230 [Clostridia bacterium]|nr:hypothetical protein [Clostridia bacterium]